MKTELLNINKQELNFATYSAGILDEICFAYTC